MSKGARIPTAAAPQSCQRKTVQPPAASQSCQEIPLDPRSSRGTRSPPPMPRHYLPQRGDRSYHPRSSQEYRQLLSQPQGPRTPWPQSRAPQTAHPTPKETQICLHLGNARSRHGGERDSKILLVQVCTELPVLADMSSIPPCKRRPSSAPSGPH